MERGIIDINKNYELEYRYYDKDTKYKYFNRKFEIFLVEKNPLKKNYVLHIDNCDISPTNWTPHIHKATNVKKKEYFGVTTLNWNDIKNNFANCIISEIGTDRLEDVRRAMKNLSSPKI